MRIGLTLLFIILTTFCGRPQQKIIFEKKDKKIISEKINTDSAEYFNAALKGDKLVYMLIEAKKKSDAENVYLRALIKKMWSEKPIIIHDTIYKKRKFLLF